MPKPPRIRVTDLPYCRWRWTAEQRFDHFTKRDPVSGCRIWQGSLANGGYGQLTFRGRSYLAHRLAWIVKNGPIPKGLHVCHRCDERRCVNTEHLFLGSHSVNMTDLRMKTRNWYTEPADRRRRKSTADVAPIRIRYRGIEFFGNVAVRVFEPGAKPPIPLPAPPAGRAPGGRSRRCAARRGRPRRTASPAKRGR
ncbi:MAG: HNH endonuclease [Proteobacteria bacterium]|nr:HNH endonuclease [Pseudomonadota bacterium]